MATGFPHLFHVLTPQLLIRQGCLLRNPSHERDFHNLLGGEPPLSTGEAKCYPIWCQPLKMVHSLKLIHDQVTHKLNIWHAFNSKFIISGKLLHQHCCNTVEQRLGAPLSHHQPQLGVICLCMALHLFSFSFCTN